MFISVILLSWLFAASQVLSSIKCEMIKPFVKNPVTEDVF